MTTPPEAPRKVSFMGSQFLVFDLRVFFRAADWLGAFQLTATMLGVRAGGDLSVGVSGAVAVAAVTVGMLGWHAWQRGTTYEDRWRTFPVWLQAGLVGLMLFSLLIATPDDRAFIYFQF